MAVHEKILEWQAAAMDSPLEQGDSNRALYPAAMRATALGAKFLLALGVGTIGVKLVAVIYDGAGSLAPLWLTLAGSAGFVAAAGLFLLAACGGPPRCSIIPSIRMLADVSCLSWNRGIRYCR